MRRVSLVLSAALLFAGCDPRVGQRPRSRLPPAAPSASGVGSVAPSPPAEGARLSPGSPPPPVAGPIGTPHPIWVIAAGATGTWVAFCQARQDTNGDGSIEVNIGPHGDPYGDVARPFLRVGQAPERPIDAFVSADPRGRWFVIELGGRRLLVDADTGRDVDLGPLARLASASPDAPERDVASFDATGEHLLHLGPPPRPKLVVRELSTGRLASVDPGPGKLLGAALAGPWVIASMIPRDTDGDGRLGGPKFETNLYEGPCAGPPASSSLFVFGPGDRRVTRAAPATGGVARDVAGFVGAVGDALLVRSPTGALSLQGVSGGPSEVASASCQGRVVAAHAPTKRLLVACRQGSSKRATLELHGPGHHRGLGEDVDLPDGDPLSTTSERLLVTSGKGATLVVDAETGRLRRFTQSEVLFTMGERVLLRNDRSLLVTDFGANAETPLPGNVERYPRFLKRGRLAYVEPLVVDLVAGTTVAAFRGQIDPGPPFAVTELHRRPLALAESGHFLVPEPLPAPLILEDLPKGPLVWAWPDARVTPAPPRAPSAPNRPR